MIRHNNTHPKEIRSNTFEQGSAFFYILLAVVLFGTLAFTVSRGMRGQQASTMSDRKAELTANEFLNYAQKIQHAIDSIRRNGCSENDISMETPAGLNINPSAPTDKSCHVFNPNGGNMVWHVPTNGVTNNSYWRASTHSNISNIGTGKAELLLYIPSVNKAVCEKINKSANIIRDTIPLENGYAFNGSWDGAFSDIGPHVISCDGVAPTGACNNQSFACIESDVSNAAHGKYIFYYTLIER